MGFRNLKGRNIRVNAISPGVIETPGYGAVGMSAADLEGYFGFTAKGTALERNGTPDDVASVVAFLASDESRFMTGTEVFVDGGFAQI
jgi:NAD(P)-dependent dehydrogenase (short-subunit alcohol dehydrogenase family)